MISEDHDSCDTEDWRNDAENTALISRINYILKFIKQETNIRHWIIFQNTFFLYFDQINTALMSWRASIKKQGQLFIRFMI